VVATLEEHSLIGGFGSAVAEWAADTGPHDARLVRVGTRDQFLHEAGNQAFARDWYGLTTDAITTRVLGAYRAAEGSAPVLPR
jgi:transketolase